MIAPAADTKASHGIPALLAGGSARAKKIMVPQFRRVSEKPRNETNPSATIAPLTPRRRYRAAMGTRWGRRWFL